MGQPPGPCDQGVKSCQPFYFLGSFNIFLFILNEIVHEIVWIYCLFIKLWGLILSSFAHFALPEVFLPPPFFTLKCIKCSKALMPFSGTLIAAFKGTSVGRRWKTSWQQVTRRRLSNLCRWTLDPLMCRYVVTLEKMLREWKQTTAAMTRFIIFSFCA